MGWEEGDTTILKYSNKYNPAKCCIKSSWYRQQQSANRAGTMQVGIPCLQMFGFYIYCASETGLHQTAPPWDPPAEALLQQLLYEVLFPFTLPAPPLSSPGLGLQCYMKGLVISTFLFSYFQTASISSLFTDLNNILLRTPSCRSNQAIWLDTRTLKTLVLNATRVVLHFWTEQAFSAL